MSTDAKPKPDLVEVSARMSKEQATNALMNACTQFGCSRDFIITHPEIFVACLQAEISNFKAILVAQAINRLAEAVKGENNISKALAEIKESLYETNADSTVTDELKELTAAVSSMGG